MEGLSTPARGGSGEADRNAQISCFLSPSVTPSAVGLYNALQMSKPFGRLAASQGG